MSTDVDQKDVYSGLNPMPVVKVRANETIIVQKLYDEVTKTFPNYQELKHVSWFLDYIMTKIENFVKKKLNVDKYEIVLQLFIQLFSLNDNEKKTLKQNVEFLLDKNLIKKIGISRKVFKYFKKQLPQL